MDNYFNKLTFLQKLEHLKKCRFVNRFEFSESIALLSTKKIAIIGCGSQGLNQGLNMRDSGMHVSYALRHETVNSRGHAYIQAINHGFQVGTYEDIIPESDIIINLAPDKFHTDVVKAVQPLMKYEACLGYSHGFNIVEIGEKIRSDITVIMVAPKCPGSEVREEYKRGFGVPALIAVHSDNDPRKEGLILAKAWAAAIGSHRAGVLESSFVAEVKSDLMGEQTILCGVLQVASVLFFNRMVSNGINPSYAGKLIQYGWSVITESLKQGGITLMMDRLSNSAKLRAFDLSEQLKVLFAPLFEKHMNNIITGHFSKDMILDWEQGDQKLLEWREKNSLFDFEHVSFYHDHIDDQVYFNHGILMIAIIRAGIELAFEIMVKCGISHEIAYYESLHELPLIANTIARKRLYGMNMVISDTAEYGNYLFSISAFSLLDNFILSNFKIGDLGTSITEYKINNIDLRIVNETIRQHPIEQIGAYLRKYMSDMKEVKMTGN